MEWNKVSEKKIPFGEEVIAFNEKWIDEDFNPNGTRIGFLQDDGFISATWNDKQVVFVDRFYPSSKTCSVCGYKKRDLRLSDREWVCPICGTKHDRDINAAMNILIEGQRMLTA